MPVRKLKKVLTEKSAGLQEVYYIFDYLMITFVVLLP